MNYILTGSAGLIGEHLKKRLDEKKHNCILEFDIRKGSNVSNINNINLNPDTQKVDIFFHLASSCKINKCIENPNLAHYNNSEGTFQALEFCRKNNIKKFVYFSSSRVLSPEANIYTASKLYGEELCKAYKECYGIEYLIIRPSTVYGEHVDITTRLLTTWIKNALNGEPLILYGDTDKSLDFTYIDDFLDGLDLLIESWYVSKNQDYNISGNDTRKLIDVANIINLNTKVNPFTVLLKEPEIAQPQQVKIDISKMKALKYKPKIKLEEGISKLVEFYKEANKNG